MKLYLLRHGETDYNKKGIIQGDLEIPLNEDGRHQALEAKEKTDKLEIDLIICSPIKRTVETANIVNEGRNIPLIFDDRLKERKLGGLVGKNYLDYRDKLYLDSEKNYNDYGVEPVTEILKRTNEFLKEIKEKYLDKNILVVSHEAPIKSIVMNIDGLDKRFIKIANCELLEYEIG